jgi:Zn-dependent metalloprotease
MVFGDGDGTVFVGFTSSLSVIGHELTHGATQYSANLTYEGQSGALNESISDVSVPWSSNAPGSRAWSKAPRSGR